MISSFVTWFHKAKKVLPGGVNSPVRAFQSVGGTPLFFERGEGPYLFDIEQQRFIDYVGAWGPLILGHQDPDVLKSLQETLSRAILLGAPTPEEVLLAEYLCTFIPSLEQVRLMNSGTEATMTALRLARGYTRREYIVKFTGCYHGHCDSLLVEAGSGALTFGIPSSPGVPSLLAKLTFNLPFNEVAPVSQLFEKMGDRIAAVIVEPIAGNMGCVVPDRDFLLALRTLCDQYGSLLIFDEIITGFRVALQGAQSLYAITPDLTALGKIIGGGLPIGAIGGKRSLLAQLAPEGPIYQAGTFAGHPLAMSAGLATLTKLKTMDYEHLTHLTQTLVTGFLEAARRHQIPLTIPWATGMLSLFFCEGPIRTFRDTQRTDRALFQRFYHGMLQEGIYFAPSPFECVFVSFAHESVIERTLEAAETVFATL